ncbi:hypothetical protein AB0J01_28280 [Streptomyces sp. NPDC050204]|uniref:hypothetical protein n=1 Tax=Streptomyces sp. NPDC050204 TaxID=3155514 RepID=UPI0034309732
MNLYPGDSIEAATTRTPATTGTGFAPGTVATGAANSFAGRTTRLRLDPGLFADRAALRAAVADWSREELFAI